MRAARIPAFGLQGIVRSVRSVGVSDSYITAGNDDLRLWDLSWATSNDDTYVVTRLSQWSICYEL